MTKPTRRQRNILTIVPITAAGVLVAGLLAAPWAAASHVQPERHSGNQSCSDVVPASNELKIEPVKDGTYTDGTLEVTISGANSTFDWESNLPVQVVAVKGGPDTNVYDYRPDGETSDDGLRAPTHPKSGEQAGLSHASFCYKEHKEPDPTPTPPPPEPDFCTGHAFDVRVDAEGIVDGYAGPAIKTQQDVFPDNETLSELALFMPVLGATEPVATAVTLEADNSGTPEEGCTTRITYEDFELDLNNLSDAGGVPVVLTAQAVETIATATLQPDGSVTTDSEVTIVGGSLHIDGEGDELAVQPDPDTGIIDECLEAPDGVGSLCVRVVLHETETIPGGIAANAVRVTVDLQTPLPGTDQFVDVQVAHAEADAHEGDPKS
ncbi:choice-of-anchor P family protein [Haloechinothrix sp. LS1_15]|uniref:choice-of-anchor P family protein n=1 Tax=Haloechinothrix sp. LS1_15 TaxID=2652248 RepID=UPI002947CD5B|nr:choice-of-anchor P family protein [Haloechinothrix sp. LS1_15]MDV6012413.1 hypothetical protein [Haloechinothrix sp. LS1_15]